MYARRLHSVGLSDVRRSVARTAAWLALSIAGHAWTPMRAHADAVGLSDACPPGSDGEVRHVGSWCRVAACTEGCDSADLPRRCEPRRVCTEERSVWAGSPAAAAMFGDPGEETIVMVVETCAAEETCDGSGDRAPTAGTLIEGSQRCEVQRVCVPEPLPALSSRLSPEAPEVPDVPATEPAPSADPSGCGCRASTRVALHPAWLALLIGLAIRRRR